MNHSRIRVEPYLTKTMAAWAIEQSEIFFSWLSNEQENIGFSGHDICSRMVLTVPADTQQIIIRRAMKLQHTFKGLL
jgi:hypothetical protein